MAVAKPVQAQAIVGTQSGDQIFRAFLIGAALLVLLVMIALIAVLISGASTSISEFGFLFFAQTDWNPPSQLFGALAYIYGTIVTSIIALLLATPFAIGAAIYVSEYAPRWLGSPISFCVELLVTIPSVVYGLWGYFTLAPFMRRTIEPFLKNTIGEVPIIGALFQGPATGRNYLTAGVILAIMITPTILSISREIITQVPRLQKEGVMALGATKWETIRYSILPYARGGIIGAAMLGLARAIGETMAVTMVIGNSSTGRITPSLLNTGATIASTIANQYGDTVDALHNAALIELGLVLLIVASVFTIGARVLVRRISKLPGARA